MVEVRKRLHIKLSEQALFVGILSKDVLFKGIFKIWSITITVVHFLYAIATVYAAPNVEYTSSEDESFQIMVKRDKSFQLCIVVKLPSTARLVSFSTNKEYKFEMDGRLDGIVSPKNGSAQNTRNDQKVHKSVTTNTDQEPVQYLTHNININKVRILKNFNINENVISRAQDQTRFFAVQGTLKPNHQTRKDVLAAIKILSSEQKITPIDKKYDVTNLLQKSIDTEESYYPNVDEGLSNNACEEEKLMPKIKSDISVLSSSNAQCAQENRSISKLLSHTSDWKTNQHVVKLNSKNQPITKRLYRQTSALSLGITSKKSKNSKARRNCKSSRSRNVHKRYAAWCDHTGTFRLLVDTYFITKRTPSTATVIWPNQHPLIPHKERRLDEQ